MKAPFLKLLGWMLHVANSNPPMWKRDFYAMKEAILSRYGVVTGHDIQHIKKICWGCDGTGTWAGYDNGFRWVECAPAPCRRCGATGVFDEFWVVLEKWDLAGYQFHRPLFKARRQEDPRLTQYARGEIFGEPYSLIEGYVEHRRYPFYLSRECAYWLALFFDRCLFFKMFGHVGHPSRKFTPMVIAGSVVFNVRMFTRNLRWRVSPYRSKLKRIWPGAPEEDLPF